jgi:peptidoglycan hydrolase-like protein with peptidoglycan-binding domain
MSMSKGKRLAKPASATAIFIKDSLAALRSRLGLGDEVSDYGDPTVFEALEPRVLLSANPFTEIAGQERDKAQNWLNDNVAAIYMAANTAETVETVDLDAVEESLQSSAGAGGALGADTASNPLLRAESTIQVELVAPETAVVGQSVTFISTATDSTYPIMSQSLTINNKFCAASTDGTLSYTHIFDKAGTYKVVVSAENLIGQTASTSYTIKINMPAFADISHNGGSSIAQGQEVEFTVFGDSSEEIIKYTLTINGEDIEVDDSGKGSYVFWDAGSYTVTASVVYANGEVGTITQEFHIAARFRGPRGFAVLRRHEPVLRRHDREVRCLRVG